MKRITLRARLTVLYGALFFVAGAALLGVTYFLVEQSLDARTRPSKDSASIAASRVRDSGSSTFTMPNGQTLNSSQIISEVKKEQKQFKADALRSLLTRGGLALIAVGAVAGVGGWLVAGRALGPIHRITGTANRIASSNGAGRGLHERIALVGPDDEVKRLADTFDAMLGHLDRSFEGQRRFVANASHELRTPLALNRALAELAATRPDAVEETKQLAQSLLEVNERHEQLIDGLLTLADSENAVTDPTPVDLGEVARRVTATTAPAARAADVEIRSTVESAGTTGDPVLLERLVHNLVENGVRHNHPGGWVSIETGSAAGKVTVTVANTGAVIPGDQIDSLFEPFRRLGEGRAGPHRGFGLGLSIVGAIVQAHGGEVRAIPRDGGGLTVTVRL